jgi:hypothetical protein
MTAAAQTLAEPVWRTFGSNMTAMSDAATLGFSSRVRAKKSASAKPLILAELTLVNNGFTMNSM